MPKIGVVFSNLGTPKAAEPWALKEYLNEFLMDHHVMQMPWLFRAALVKCGIIPIRHKKSAANYSKIWTDQGSPLLVETKKAAHALQQRLGENYKVVVAMRYGEPGFAQAQDQLKNCDEIVFFPQYPQYAASTVQTGLDHFYRYFDKKKSRVVEPYYDHPVYIEAYVKFLSEQMSRIQFDHLLMSFHGLPESHLVKSDPTGRHCLQSMDCCEKAKGAVLKTCYRTQCYHSAAKLAEGLGMTAQAYSLSFQSRMGRQKWIEPYTEKVLGQLVSQGVRSLAVICPGFSVDGLETLEEIAMRGKEVFMAAGGESFHFIPCLNDNEHWIEACAELVKQT